MAATSWHWIDPSVRYAKAASVLDDRGHIAFFNARHAFPADVDPFFFEIQAVYEEIGETGNQWGPPAPPEEVPDDVDEIMASGLFTDVQVRRHVWEIPYKLDEYLALIDTFSTVVAMDKDKRAYLYDEIRSRIGTRPDRSARRHRLAILHVARRV